MSVLANPTPREVNFRDDVFYQIAAELLIDPEQDITTPTARRWTRLINRFTAEIWRMFPWPELMVIEERAFAPIWTSRAFAAGDVVFDVAQSVAGNVPYFQAVSAVPAGILITNTTYWTPYTQVAGDFHIPLLQDCRRRIGEVQAVYATDPRPFNTNSYARTYPFEISERGIEIIGPASHTVFLKYKLPPPKYTSEVYDSTQTYPQGGLTLWGDSTVYGSGAQVYRALAGIAGHAPAVGGNAYWAPVPFPAAFADYVVYSVAAREADDLNNASRFTTLAREAMQRSVDALIAQGAWNLNYGATTANSIGFWGYNYYGLTTLGATTATLTIDATCVNEWGDPTDPPAESDDMQMLLELSVPLVAGQGYVDIPFGATADDTSWTLESCSIEYTGTSLTDSEITIPSYVIKNRTTTGFRVLLDGAMDDDAADYLFRCAVAGVTS